MVQIGGVPLTMVTAVLAVFLLLKFAFGALVYLLRILRLLLDIIKFLRSLSGTQSSPASEVELGNLSLGVEITSQ